jgi:hypothetical protein
LAFPKAPTSSTLQIFLLLETAKGFVSFVLHQMLLKWRFFSKLSCHEFPSQTCTDHVVEATTFLLANANLFE